MPGIPKSVAALNKWPYPFAKYTLGTRFYQWTTFMRELHASLASGGGVQDLVNELRTRLNTAGDYQVLISAIRALLVSGGDIADRLLDLEDKAFNQILVDPDWKQNTGGGGNTQFENGTAIDAVVNGVYLAAVYAATQDTQIDAGGAGADTGAGEYRAITLGVSSAGVLSQTISAVAAAAPVEAPRVPSGEVGVGVIQIPENFTNGVTAVQTAWFTQGYPRRLAVHTPLATADVAAISAGALTDPSATIPDALPDTDI